MGKRISPQLNCFAIGRRNNRELFQAFQSPLGPVPVTLDVFQGQPEQLGSCIFCWGVSQRRHDLAWPGVGALDGVGPADRLAEVRMEGEEGIDLEPASASMSPPRSGTSCHRPLLKRIQLGQGALAPQCCVVPARWQPPGPCGPSNLRSPGCRESGARCGTAAWWQGSGARQGSCRLIYAANG